MDGTAVRYILKVNTYRPEKVMKITKVFKSGNSLAVRLPKEFAVKEKELCITRVGNAIVLFPPEKKWDVIFEEFERVKELCGDFLEERNQPGPQERELF